MAKKKQNKKWKKRQKYMQQHFGMMHGLNPFDEAPTGLSRMLPGRTSEQFLLGAVIGAAGAYLLADEKMRAKLLKGGMGLYAGLAGGLAEMKEQMADIKAEMDAEQDEDEE